MATTDTSNLEFQAERIARDSDTNVDEEFSADTASIQVDAPSSIPGLFISPPPIRDALETPSSYVQEHTMDECLPYLTGEGDEPTRNAYGIPGLRRQAHVKFLHKNLGRLPAPYLAADASRPWFLFWCLNALCLLGEDVSIYRENLVETARTMQNPTGGFGGGHGQTSHLATSYAVVLALAVVGGEEVYEVIDRRGMWRWLCSLKQADGGFQMVHGGEVDVRGAYCAAVIISLLNIPLDLAPESPAWTADPPTLFTGLADYVRKCQTFEGGISGKPDAEAHGAYAFCALGCLSILDSPHKIIPKYLDIPRLIAWLSSRQYAPEGGFSGRTNKLVDGCYSHWVGGCWPLIDAAIRGPSGFEDESSNQPSLKESLYSREGLIRYIMCCCQDEGKRGGLRDKPSKPSDAYHTCYVLSGLSSAQHQWNLTYSDADDTILSEPRWMASPCDEAEQVFDERDRVNVVDPVYTIPQNAVESIKRYFASKQGF